MRRDGKSLGLPIISSPSIWSESFLLPCNSLSLCHRPKPLPRVDPILETTPVLGSRLRTCQPRGGRRRVRGVRNKALTVTRSPPPEHSSPMLRLCCFPPCQSHKTQRRLPIHFLDTYFFPDTHLSLYILIRIKYI